MKKNITINLTKEEAEVLLMGLFEAKQMAWRQSIGMKQFIEEYRSKALQIKSIAESLEELIKVSFEPEALALISENQKTDAMLSAELEDESLIAYLSR